MVNGAQQLPSGWEWTTLGKLANYINGRAFKPTDWETTGRPIIRIQNLTRSTSTLNRFSGEVESKYIIRDGDLLISWSATLGAFIYRGEEAVLNQHIFKVEPFVNKKFLFYLVTAYLDTLKRQVHGSGMQHITKGKFDNSPVPLPPPDEQERIVAKIEELFTQLEAGTSALERVQAGLRRYKASMLKAGMDGTLLGNGKNNDEFPEGWQNVQLVDVLSESLTNGKSTPNAENGFPVLRLTALKDGRIDLSERKIGAWTKEQAKNYLVKRGDFFVSRGNGSLHLVGRGGLVEQEPDDVAYPDTLIRIRVSPTDCDINYLRTIWNSNFIRNQIETTARTTAGIYKINQKDLESFTFPLPPLEEQRRIVAEVERRLSVAREVESVVEKALARSARLRQAVLKSAFEGKLT